MTNSKTPQKVRKALQLYFDAVPLIQSFKESPLRYWLYPILGWWLYLHSFRLRDCGDDGRLSQKQNFPSYCSAAQKSQMKVEESGNLCFPFWKPPGGRFHLFWGSSCGNTSVQQICWIWQQTDTSACQNITRYLFMIEPRESNAQTKIKRSKDFEEF